MTSSGITAGKLSALFASHAVKTAVPQVAFVWHLTHVANLPSILLHGLRSHAKMQHAPYHDISDQQVQSRRASKRVLGQVLHDMVPTFFVQKNPMAYRLQSQAEELVWLQIAVNALDARHCITADGNAACEDTRFYQGVRSDCLPWPVLQAPSWCDLPDGRRQRAAELLVSQHIAPKAIVALEVVSRPVAEAIIQAAKRWKGDDIVRGLDVRPESFFR